MKNLLLIVTLAFLLRFYQLGENPPSINWDEASNGYNAYSILNTLRDERGNLLPLFNRSFDDYKPPLYMYLNVASVKLFGLNEYSVRFPSALFGTALILLVYFLSLKITGNKKTSQLASLFIAFFPWTMHFSRVGFESNIGLFFTTASFTSLIWSFPNGPKVNKSNLIMLIFSAILFSLTFYSYHSARIFSPIMIFTVLIICRERILLFPKKAIAIFFIIPLVLIAPFFITAPKEAINQRYKTVTLGAQKESTDEYIKFVQEDNNNFFARLIHHRKILVGRIFVGNYLSHFNPEFIFITGDRNLRHHVEGFGMAPLFLLPSFLVGLFFLVKHKNKNYNFLLSWLLISPIPAIPADAAPHAIRSIALVIPLSVLTSMGIINLLTGKFIRLVPAFFVCFFCFSFLHNYYFHYNKEKTEFWMYGFKEAVEKSNVLKNEYSVINVDSSIEQGYIFWLFYNKYDPTKFRENFNSQNVENISFNDNKVEEGEVFISLADHFIPDLKLIDTIYYPNGKEAIKIGRRKYSWENEQ